MECRNDHFFEVRDRAATCQPDQSALPCLAFLALTCLDLPWACPPPPFATPQLGARPRSPSRAPTLARSFLTNTDIYIFRMPMTHPMPMPPLIGTSLAHPGTMRGTVLEACERPPLSTGIVATDAAVVSLYSLSTSVTMLFTSGEYLEPPVVSLQDFVDIGYAFECAAALVAGWAIGSLIAGASSSDWFFKEHATAPLGLYRVLPAWLLAWPLGAALKLLATEEYARATPGITAAVDMQAIAMDGAGLLVSIWLWRTWLLAWASDRW